MGVRENGKVEKWAGEWLVPPNDNKKSGKSVSKRRGVAKARANIS